MLHVMQRVSDGYDLTGASIEAGFASPSHFSDAFNRMFGLSVTTLLTTGVTINFGDDDGRNRGVFK
jgi:methylphosphotriester-DNA--protein-cysteine methyltransferase